MQICFSIMFVVIGLVGIFAKDWTWRWQEYKNRMGGIQSQRTDTWDTSTTIGGIIFVAIGVISFIILTSQ